MLTIKLNQLFNISLCVELFCSLAKVVLSNAPVSRKIIKKKKKILLKNYCLRMQNIVISIKIFMRVCVWLYINSHICICVQVINEILLKLTYFHMNLLLILFFVVVSKNINFKTVSLHARIIRRLKISKLYKIKH